jgi:titin
VLLASGSSGNQVLGNYIGTNNAGSASMANKVGVEDAGSSNTIGGSVSGARNVISGNTGDGVLLDSTATAEALQGNYIGVNAFGNGALANSGNGVEVKGNTNTLGGSVFQDRNYIGGNSKDGVLIASGASGNQVLGNFIGIDTSGTNGVGNVVNGIEIAGSSNTIGGTASGTRNVISGSGNDGVLIDSTGAKNAIQGNYVGTDYTGTGAVANSANGIEIAGNNNTVGGSASGATNIIAHNSKNGVLIDSTGSGDTVSQNSIFANGGLGISLASGANNNLAAPTISTATLVSGTLTVTGTFNAPTANVSYVLEFFANPSGDAEGKIFLGSLTVTPTSTGTQTFTFSTTTTVTGTYPLITATLTDGGGDTSSFSNGATTN